MEKFFNFVHFIALLDQENINISLDIKIMSIEPIDLNEN